MKLTTAFRMPLLALGTAIFLALPGMARAADAVTTENLNMRSGPDTDYGVIAVIPEGDEIEVHGCVEEYNWCDVSWAGFRGWSYAEYLAHVKDDRIVFWHDYAPRANIPLIVFSFGAYHDRHYRKRPWHRKRGFSIRRENFLADIRRGRFDKNRRRVRRELRTRLLRDREELVRTRRDRIRDRVRRNRDRDNDNNRVRRNRDRDNDRNRANRNRDRDNDNNRVRRNRDRDNDNNRVRRNRDRDNDNNRVRRNRTHDRDQVNKRAIKNRVRGQKPGADAAKKNVKKKVVDPNDTTPEKKRRN